MKRTGFDHFTHRALSCNPGLRFAKGPASVLRPKSSSVFLIPGILFISSSRQTFRVQIFERGSAEWPQCWGRGVTFAPRTASLNSRLARSSRLFRSMMPSSSARPPALRCPFGTLLLGLLGPVAPKFGPRFRAFQDHAHSARQNTCAANQRQNKAQPSAL